MILLSQGGRNALFSLSCCSFYFFCCWCLFASFSMCCFPQLVTSQAEYGTAGVTLSKGDILLSYLILSKTVAPISKPSLYYWYFHHAGIEIAAFSFQWSNLNSTTYMSCKWLLTVTWFFAHHIFFSQVFFYFSPWEAKKNMGSWEICGSFSTCPLYLFPKI